LPQILEAFDDVQPRTGVLQYGDYTNDTAPVLRVGLTAESAAGDVLQLTDNGTIAAPSVTLTADDLSRGYVDFQLSALGPDWHLLTATDLGPDGAAKAASMPWALGVSTAIPAAPTIVSVTDDAGASTGALADGARTDDSTPTLQVFEAGLPDPPTSPPGHAPYGGPALLSGTLELFDGQTLVATGLIGYGGTVTLTSSALAPGDHVLTAVAVDRAGDASVPSAPFHLTVGPDAPAPGGDRATNAGDVLQANEGFTAVDGGQGADTISGWTGADYLRGGDGGDVINGGSGFDDANGNRGDDTVHGGAGDDWVLGGQGDDRLFGDDGRDIVLGNLGDDTQDGGAGDDLMRGGQGDDVLSGGDGADWLSGDRGADTITGGAGADVFHTFAGAGLDVVTDFNAAEGDRVQLDPGTAYSVSQVGLDVHIDLAGGEMVLQHVQLSTLPTGWIFSA